MINQDHLDNLFIRTYNTNLIGHSHNYHQILIPLLGNINLIINGKLIIVSYGEVCIIPKGVHHQFTARMQTPPPPDHPFQSQMDSNSNLK